MDRSLETKISIHRDAHKWDVSFADIFVCSSFFRVWCLCLRVLLFGSCHFTFQQKKKNSKRRTLNEFIPRLNHVLNAMKTLANKKNQPHSKENHKNYFLKDMNGGISLNLAWIIVNVSWKIKVFHSKKNKKDA